MLKKNDMIHLSIESITNLGFGVGRYGKIVVFVSDCVTGDEIEARIIKTTPTYAVGRVEKFTKKSEKRVSDRCCVSGCLGCAYKAIGYTDELDIKKSDVKAAFAKAGLPEIRINDVTPSPKLTSYRNKAQFPVMQNRDGSYTVGYYAPKSHRVREARECPLTPSEFTKIVNTVTDFLCSYKISAYDEQSGNGLLRHIYIRRGEVSGEILLTLVINGDKLPESDVLSEMIKQRHPSVVGLLLNINKEKTNIILGEKFITLFGRDYIFDTLAGVELKISAPAFYQVNHGAAELLYAMAKKLAEPRKSDTLLDLYCGTGSIGLSMADSVSRLFGIEINQSAVLCAKENARRMGADNAMFFASDAGNTEQMLCDAERELGEAIKPDIVVLDPPRGGSDSDTLKFVASLSPRSLVYISCNAQTLARDMALLKELGYVADAVHPFDLFPMTGHVECVTLLYKKK